MQLLIDNKPVIVKKGTSIRLTRENPAISQNGDYTLDVTLPLAGCLENINVFGIPHYRHQPLVGLADKTYQFAMEASRLRLTGTAVVTQVSEEEIKLQLLAGNTEFNFDNREGGDKYIDELNLGAAYGDIFEDEKKYSVMPEKQTPRNTLRLLHSKARLIPDRKRAEELMHGTNDQTDCVLFPIYSTTDDEIANRQAWQWWCNWLNHEHSNTPQVEYSGYRFTIKGTGDLLMLPNSVTYENVSDIFSEYNHFSPQPYLCVILEKVLAAIGYTLSTEDNCMREGWLGKIFVANARETIYFRECLPHWTVEEFLTELRNAFGIILYVDGKNVKAVSRESIYQGAGQTNIFDVIDERTTEISTEADNKGTTTGNVSYNFSDVVPKMLNIGTAPYENMNVERVTAITQTNINDRLENGTDEEKDNIYKSASLFYRKTIGDRYAVFNKSDKTGAEGDYKLQRVDHLGPLFREENFDSGTGLNIVPCFMMEDKPTYRQRLERFYIDDHDNDIYRVGTFLPETEDPTTEEGGRYNGFFVPFLVTEDTLTAYSTPKFSLQQYIDTGTGEVETSDSEHKDIMEVAVNAGIYTRPYNIEPEKDTSYLTQSAKIPYPIGARFTFSRKNPDEIKTIGTENFFALHGKPESKIVQALNGSALKYDGRVVHQFSFTDREYDPTKVFIINGRRFACQKLELTINEEGISPLIKGYFFELE